MQCQMQWFQMGYHKSRVEGGSHLPRTYLSHFFSCNTGYDSLSGLWAYIASSFPLFCPLGCPSSSYCCFQSIYPPVNSDTCGCPASGLGPFTWPYWTSWNFTWAQSSSLWMFHSSCSSSTMNCSTQFGITSRLASVSLPMPLIETLNNSGSSIDPWKTALGMVFHFAIEPLIKFSYMAIQFIPYPPKSAFITSMSFQFSQEFCEGPY